MKYKQNLHTHSTYCDGKDSPREVIRRAIEKDFDSIGFSCHSPMFYSEKNGIKNERIIDYVNEIDELKREYEDQIEIFCGWEYDIYSNINLKPYDYIIGSLHYFNINGEFVGFDRSEQEVKRVIDTYFGGNGMLYAKKYYEDIAQLAKYGDFDILGHFDLITKHSENTDFFDIKSDKYLNAAKAAIKALSGKIPLFEVNTGAISRGYRTAPYPMSVLIREFNKQGFGVVISSDCHDANYLDCYFDEAAELLRECGFKEKYIFTKDGFKAVSL